MAIPKNPPRRYTASRQLIGGDDFNNLNDQLNSFQTLTPAGATQAAAAQINASHVELLTAGAAGVVLPVSYPGAVVCILNNSGNAQNVYPAGTDQVQNAATTYAGASTAVSLVSLASACYYCIKTGFWQRSATA